MIEKEKVWETLEEKDEMSDSDEEKVNGDDREGNCGDPDSETTSSDEDEAMVC